MNATQMHTYEGFINHLSSQRLNKQTLVGSVHSCFTHTMNVVLNIPFPNMLSLGGPQLMNSPNSIVVKDFPRLLNYLENGDVCRLEGDQLLLGNYAVIQLRDSPMMEISIQSNHHNSQLEYQLIRKVIESYLLENNPYDAVLSQHPFVVQFQLEAQQLIEAITIKDWGQLAYHGRRLIGLGIGLTPTGDDFLTGLLLTLQVECDLYQSVKELIFGKDLNITLLQATNLISQHQLYFALQGEAKPSLLALIQTIQTEGSAELDLEKVKALLEEIVSIGSTSGYDLLSGVLAALYIMERMECQ